ncbi:MAG: extracellular solute-binding protein [Eubacteriales bacterium]|nr:extracellular solute-binding protein [Eubacteriales bacterium]
MRLKKLAAAAAAVSFAFALSACGGSSASSDSANDNSQAADTNTEASGDQVVINFFHRWPNDPKNTMFKNLIAKYEEENPNVKINMDCILNDQYKEKIRMIVGTDEVPDIFSSWSGSFAKEMIDSGNVLDLTSVFEDDPEWADTIADVSKGPFTFDGKLMAVPWSQDGKAFFYNKRIFEENGLEVPKTWDEFINVLDKLKAAGYETPITEGLKDQWAILHYLGTMNQRMVDPEVLAADYDPATGEFTDPAYVDVLEKWQQLTSYMGEVATAIDHETARNTYFATEESPIMYLQFAEINIMKDAVNFDYGFFNFPAFSEGKGDPNALTGAPEGFMISNKAKNRDECIKFLKWLVSVDGGAVALTTEAGDLTSVKGAITAENALPAQIEALETIDSASQMAPWFDNACDASIYTVFGQGASAIASGDETPEQVMTAVQAAASELRAKQ